MNSRAGSGDFWKAAQGALIGAVIVMSVWLYREVNASDNSAIGQTVATSGNITLASGKLSGKGDADAIYLYDNDAKRLLVYFQNGNSLELLSIRNTEWDFKPEMFSAQGGKQSPTPDELKEALKKKK
ncbi:MAG: hypothetical protein ACKVX7_06035 [Planctomycetota bacterium]